MRPSLRRRLLFLLSGTVLAAWLATAAFIAGVDAADMSLTFRHFFFGAMNAREWSCFQRIHDGDHGPQILRIRASAGFPAA